MHKLCFDIPIPTRRRGITRNFPKLPIVANGLHNARRFENTRNEPTDTHECSEMFNPCRRNQICENEPNQPPVAIPSQLPIINAMSDATTRTIEHRLWPGNAPL